MQGGERWPPAINPSAKLKSRVMPPWIARGSAIPPPPPPPITDPPPVEPEYEVIDFGQTYSNQPVIRSNKENARKRCDLCGSSVPAVRCLQCVQQNFCYSCDEMYHRHPKRQSHVRKELDGGKLPPLPPKGEPPPPPVPPPRRNKRPTPRPSPVPPPHPGLHSPPQSVSPKPGLVGSLKKIIGVRPLPQAPHTLDRQSSMPPSSSMMNFQDQQIMNGFPDWTEMHRGHRSGSFSAMNPPNFGPMMQAHSMAQLNCPSCHGHGVWNPWGGSMGPQGMWQSQSLLNQHGPPGQEDWSGSDSDSGWQRERLRRFSTMSARIPRNCEDPRKGLGRRQDSDTLSNRGGRRRQDSDTLSNRGGRHQDFDNIPVRGGKRQDFDTLSVRGGKRQDFDTMSLRGGRRSDLESPSIRSHRKLFGDKLLRRDRHRDNKESDSSDERESDEDFIPLKGRHKVLSDIEDFHRNRRRSEPASPIPQLKNRDSTLKKKTRRNERFSDTGRRRSSPIQYKYESPSGDEEEKPQLPKEELAPQKIENGIEFIDANPVDDNEDEELASIPDVEWECRHCTFVNEGGTRVCAVCCKTNTKPKLQKAQAKPQPKPQSPPAKLDGDLKKLNLEDKVEKEPPKKIAEKTEKAKERRGTESPEGNPRTHTTSTGTSPPPQSISTQTYEEGGRKLKRATSLADYGDWKPPQRSASRQSLLSDTQSFRRAGSQPPEYFSSIVQKQVKQGLEMVKLLREAEEKGFTADELGVAVEHCGNEDPLAWLEENWINMVETVVTLGTNYGRERKENTVGTISTVEAREALTLNAGNVWAAVTHCVQQRQRKYAELLSRGNFSREDIVTVLTANQGNIEEAYKELNKNQLKPFLMRIWGPPQGADNEDGDFTKLAHGEVEGRGGMNSDEVSVDLSSDGNYERIESWLEEYVLTNSKSSISQSLFSTISGGLKRSASDWKVNSSLINTRSNSNIFNDKQNLDIHKYLTKLYNANDKTLVMKNHSASTINLTSAGRSDYTFSNKDKQSERRFSVGSKNSEGSCNGEPETITIKLNPTIVKTETECSPSDKKNSVNNGKQNSSEESESDPEEDSPVESHQINNTVRADIKLETDIEKLRHEKNVFSEIAAASENESESSRSMGLSKSDSQVSSESFESVHSSVAGNDLVNFEKVKSHLNKTSSTLKSDVEDHLLPRGAQEQNLSREPSSELDLNPYENINIIRKQQKQQNVSLDLMNESTNSQYLKVGRLINEDEGNSTNSEVENEQLKNTYFRNNRSKSPEKKSCLIKKLIESPDSSMSTNESDAKYEEVTSDEEMSFVENVSAAGSSNSDKVKIRIVPVKGDEIVNLSENYDLPTNGSHIEKTKIPVKITKTNHRLESTNGKSPNLIQTKRKMQAKQQKKYFASAKSDSDINDERSIDFSDESFDFYEEGRKTSVKSKEHDLSLRFSEPNSDRDVSSIPTDSEKELVNNISTDAKSPFQPHHAELLDLLKKSLTNDNVIEKLVSTLFASVIQASVEGVLKETEVHVGLKNNTQKGEEYTQNSENEIIETVKRTMELEYPGASENASNDKYELKALEAKNVERNTVSQLATTPLELTSNEIYLLDETSEIFIQQEINEKDFPHYSNGHARGIVDQEKNGMTNLDHSAPNKQDEVFEHTNKGEEAEPSAVEKRNGFLIYSLQNDGSESAVIGNNNDKIFISAEVSSNSEKLGEKRANEELIYPPNNITIEVAGQQEDQKLTSSLSMPTKAQIESESVNHSLYKSASELLTYQKIDNNLTCFQNNLAEIISDSIINEEAAKNVEDKYSPTINRVQNAEELDMQHEINLEDSVGEVVSIQEKLKEEHSNDRNLELMKDNNSYQDKSHPEVNVGQKSVGVSGSSSFKITSGKTTLEHTVNYQDNSSEEHSTVNLTGHNDISNTAGGSDNAFKASLTVKSDLDNQVNTVIETAQSEIKKTSAKFIRKKKNKVTDKSNFTKKLVQAVSEKSVPIPNIPQISSIPQTLNSIENKELSLSESSLINGQEILLQKEEEESLILADSEQQNSFNLEREARRLLAEGLVDTYQQAELVIQLKELHIDDETTIMTAAKECSSLDAALAYLQQECQLCAGKYAIKQMVSMLECEHICCVECACNYFTLQITERSINDCVCPFCKEPDILHVEEDKALTYFSNLDIFLKGIVKENIHELFQRKLRDRTLMQDPNFKWCVKCSSGFIANPRQKRLMCPDCKAITCAKCMKPWEKEHDKMSCDEYKAWMEQNDPENQLVKHLEENGVTCPNCKSKYILAKGGCMHLTCPQCKHEFCSGCTKPFRMGKKCQVSEYCEKLGLHAHHPRNCLFYLRDKEPEELERLLEDNNIDFNKVVDCDTSKRCGIQMLKETSDGLVEGICGYAIIKAGLCRAHYIESLVVRIRQSKIDPVKLLDFNEAIQELTRHGKTLPIRPQSMSEFNYRQILYKVIDEEIPLD